MFCFFCYSNNSKSKTYFGGCVRRRWWRRRRTQTFHLNRNQMSESCSHTDLMPLFLSRYLSLSLSDSVRLYLVARSFHSHASFTEKKSKFHQNIHTIIAKRMEIKRSNNNNNHCNEKNARKKNNSLTRKIVK